MFSAEEYKDIKKRDLDFAFEIEVNFNEKIIFMKSF